MKLRNFIGIGNGNAKYTKKVVITSIESHDAAGKHNNATTVITVLAQLFKWLHVKASAFVPDSSFVNGNYYTAQLMKCPSNGLNNF